MSPIRLPLLSDDPAAPFPAPVLAQREPDGLLAMGGDLSPVRLLTAYRQGIFPWYSEGQPLLWWSPDPRSVFDTAAFRLPSRFRRSLARSCWQIRTDTAFDAVISVCAHVPRTGQSGTWITPAMQQAYCELHRLGHAHSVEVFADERLVGGIYGIAIGQMFFGESMFSGESGGSKVALAALIALLSRWGWPLMDAQVENSHLTRLGARPMARPAFLAEVARLTNLPGHVGSWSAMSPPFEAAELASPTLR